MEYGEFEKWRRKAGLTLKEFAAKCKVSPKTIDGWRTRGRLPEYASAMVEMLMFDTIELRLNLSDFRKMMNQMETLNIKSIDEYVVMAVREKLAKNRKTS